MKKVILIFAFSVILTGCASTSTAMKSWVGHHMTELYLSWGPPSSTMSDGQGGTMISYYYNRDLGQIPGTAVRNHDGSVSYTAPTFVNSTAVRTFFANSQGIIYSWRWQGY